MTYLADVEIDLAQDATAVSLTVITSNECSDVSIGELLWRISNAFAKTEGLGVAAMHASLERQVEAFEDATHLKFVWKRGFVDAGYPDRLRRNLFRDGTRSLN